MQAAETYAEARRLMTVCNSCRYCEGLCAVFPAMELRRTFSDGDLAYLANLCHGCGACYIDCQFAPPHEFAVNVPKTLARLRTHSYAENAWPGAARILFHRNALVVGLIVALSVASFVTAFLIAADREALVASRGGPGAFYWLMPHSTMAWLFGGVFVLVCAALTLAQRNFLRATGGGGQFRIGQLFEASRGAARLRYLDGGGAGCYTGEAKRDRRRLYHHLTFYGFALCFISTSLATVYHYLLGWEAPYRWYDAPVVLGAAGGIGLLLGPAGLLLEKHRRDRDLSDWESEGLSIAFLLLLMLTSASGLALLLLRHTAAMSLLLAVHLGTVLAFFATLPYGKFVHGLYRFSALARYARDKEEKL